MLIYHCLANSECYVRIYQFYYYSVLRKGVWEERFGYYCLFYLMPLLYALTQLPVLWLCVKFYIEIHFSLRQHFSTVFWLQSFFYEA